MLIGDMGTPTGTLGPIRTSPEWYNDHMNCKYVTSSTEPWQKARKLMMSTRDP